MIFSTIVFFNEKKESSEERWELLNYPGLFSMVVYIICRHFRNLDAFIVIEVMAIMHLSYGTVYLE